jgi:hydrogenase/urease accessory protein HupE
MRKCIHWLYVLLLALLTSISAFAHPVSQGAIAVTVYKDRIVVQATISLEEILVANTWSGKSSKIGSGALRVHGDYLLAHMHINADGQPIVGRMLEAPVQPNSRITYRLEYELPGAAMKHLEFRQDVLREFMFAPGNPWEASYIVRIGLDGQVPSEGLLFTFREPLVFDGASASGINRLLLMSTFVRHGILHIVTGYDHLLFVAALALAVTGWRDLVKVIAVFTLAHTLTLTLAVLNVIRLPSGLVEPMIAASIVAVAVQNILWPERSHGLLRLLLAFGFGLFHGLGFAGGLLDAMAGMALDSIALAIIAFSIGVEIGHQVVVVPAYLGLTLLRKADAGVPRLSLGFQRYGSIMISLFGLVYFYAALK